MQLRSCHFEFLSLSLSCERVVFSDPAEIARRLAIPYRKEDRPISLAQPIDREIYLPTATDRIKYSLVGTSQHYGSTGRFRISIFSSWCSLIQVWNFEIVLSASGHYVSHLFFENEWYLADGMVPVIPLSTQRKPEVDVERSSLFLFHRVHEEAVQDDDAI